MAETNILERYVTEALQSVHPQLRALSSGECTNPAGQRCDLCHAGAFVYDEETTVKRLALHRFWRDIAPGVPLNPLVLSPRGREYRTVTKRRVFKRGNATVLGLIESSKSGLRPFAVDKCAIEPSLHGRIYGHVQETINKPFASPLAERLQYVIIKGNYEEFFLMLNVRSIRPETVKASNTLSKSLTRVCPEVVGVFLFEGGAEEQYYLGGNVAFTPRRFRKLYGKNEVYGNFNGRSFLYSPFSFSQVNQSVLEDLVRSTGGLLQPHGTQRLFDLYCGYGLFSLLLAGQYRSVIGIEMSPLSIQSAIANAKRLGTRNCRFVRSEINGNTIPSLLQSLKEEDAVLLDPPRGGTAEAVIEYIGGKKPTRVVHIFCNLDILSMELDRWRSTGYEVERAVPVDMFPGTSTVELVVLLRPTARM